MYQTGEKEVAVKVVAVARAIILNSNTEILGMDPILEILAMEPTTTTKIMVGIIKIRACCRCQKTSSTVQLFGSQY